MLPFYSANAQLKEPPDRGPAIVPRDPSDPSIHEGLSDRKTAGFREVEPILGILPASYDWFGGMIRAIGSVFQPFSADPTWAGWRGNYFVGFDFWGAFGMREDAEPDVREGDTPSRGEVCGRNPGDAFWVGYPRQGNVEIPPPYQTEYHRYDCYCRCDEQVACPLEPYRHRMHGGTYTQYVDCMTCFGEERIVKHDYYVGTSKGSHPGYMFNRSDSGYQECLRQSFESYAASGPGGEPSDSDVFGM